MPRRSPARFLAPVALVAAVVTIYVVAKPQLDGTKEQAAPSATTTTRTTGTSTAAKQAPKKRPAKTYTVKAGDSLGSIAESTGVSQADLLEANDLADPGSLSVGQKLKLSAP